MIEGQNSKETLDLLSQYAEKISMEIAQEHVGGIMTSHEDLLKDALERVNKDHFLKDQPKYILNFVKGLVIADMATVEIVKIDLQTNLNNL